QLTISASSSGLITLSTNHVPTARSSDLVGAGAAINVISAPVGSSVTSIANSGTASLTISGLVTAGPNTTFATTSSGAATFSGGLTGTGNLTISAASTAIITLSTTTVNHP